MNSRQQYKTTLQTLTETELLVEQQKTLDAYEKSKRGHSPTMEAVLYFDLQQVIAEMEERKEAKATGEGE